jgi:hypothetical protein
VIALYGSRFFDILIPDLRIPESTQKVLPKKHGSVIIAKMPTTLLLSLIYTTGGTEIYTTGGTDD